MTGSPEGSPLTVSVRVAVPSVAGVIAALASTRPDPAALTSTVALCPLVSPRNVTRSTSALRSEWSSGQV
jgi:hypothetical protein